MDELLKIFREEAGEHLSHLETALLELEENPDTLEPIDSAFRAMHTIKGSAGMVGYDHLAHFTHHLESFFDQVREGGVRLNKTLISSVLDARDHIEKLLVSNPPEALLMATSEVLIKQLAAQTDTARADTDPVPLQPLTAMQSYRIGIRPSPEAFSDGFCLLPLLRELSSLGQVEVTTHLLPEALNEAFDPERCAIQSNVLIRTDQPRDVLEDVFCFVLDDWQIDIQPLSPEPVDAAADSDLVPGTSAAADDAPHPPADTAQALDAPGNTRQPHEQTIKVGQHKLDRLMDQVSELVILQARVDQLAQQQNDEHLTGLAEELDRMASNLRETTFDIRMLPIGSTFGRFRRLVRDLARELGKEVHLQIEGADTELDKVVLDRLGDPLIHLLRNSLDHGIEEPEVRKARGKPAKGVLLLRAAQHQGQIQITLRDDGAGLDRDRIQAKARQRGLIDDAPLSNPQIDQLIFEPGFSTAASVSDISGRGVGMDVVKRSIEAMQGRIHLSSEPGRGTEISISLPMTLAIIDGFSVSVGSSGFVIPLEMVRECIELPAQAQQSDEGRRLINLRGELLPTIHLRDEFNLPGQPGARKNVVVVQYAGNKAGLIVDRLHGEYQTVIKPLKRLFSRLQGVNGSTILGSGEIALILDVPGLVQRITQSAASSATPPEPPS